VAEGEKSMEYLAKALNITPIYLPRLSRKIHLLGDFFSFLALLRLCFQFKPHIIHTHTAKAGTLGRIVALIYRLAGPFLQAPRSIQVYHTFHGHIFSGYFSPLKTKIFIGIERFLATLSSQIIVISPEQFEDIVHRYRIVPASKCKIIPLGLDLNRLDSSSFCSSHPPYLILWVGRITAIKDPLLLLEIIRLAKHTQKPWIFWVIGGGEFEELLKKYQKEEDLPLEFKGFQEEVGSWIQQGHLLLLTSKNEGTPLSIIEALYLKKPVVSSKVGGVPSLLEKGRGYLVDSRDPQSYLDALEKALDTCFEAQGEANRLWILQHYGLERLVRDLKTLYQGSF
jgi:glycosyltransferase involved in cell wall biosynthesis